VGMGVVDSHPSFFGGKSDCEFERTRGIWDSFFKTTSPIRSLGYAESNQKGKCEGFVSVMDLGSDARRTFHSSCESFRRGNSHF
jgi:hypothetical protein